MLVGPGLAPGAAAEGFSALRHALLPHSRDVAPQGPGQWPRARQCLGQAAHTGRGAILRRHWLARADSAVQLYLTCSAACSSRTSRPSPPLPPASGPRSPSPTPLTRPATRFEPTSRPLRSCASSVYGWLGIPLSISRAGDWQGSTWNYGQNFGGHATSSPTSHSWPGSWGTAETYGPALCAGTAGAVCAG